MKFLSKGDFDLLSLCTGKTDLSLSLIPQKLRDHIPDFEKAGIIEKCVRGESIAPEQEYRKYPARFIRMAHWSVTGRCNYRCRHCYMSAPDAKYGELDHETVMRMIDELADCGVLRVSLTGGECLVRQDFMDIVDRLLEKGIYISMIYSNGALVNKKLLHDLDDRGIHPEFNMSFDGVGYHDWLRGINGAEKAVNRAFELCREYGFPTGAEMCIFGENKHTLRETVSHLASLGCRALKTNPIGNVGEWKKNGYGEAVSRSELYQLYYDYITQYYEDGMPLSIQLGGFFLADPREPDRYDIPVYKNCSDLSKMCICGHARNVMYISPEGRALPCMALTGMEVQQKFPFITELGLSKCITDSFYMSFINTRASDYMAMHPECEECRYSRYCLGGCRASALESADDPLDLMAKDLACCEIFKEGWAARITGLMRKIKPEAVSPILKEEFWLNEAGIKK
ncbi:MAG: radical SAM protein [Ruminococcus sp.]|nr:radical SAM protein [Ruminococcus sp.]